MDNETIKKYLANQLSPIEKNAFEQEMEADPFLKESIEGFETKTDNDFNFSNIKQELNIRIDAKVKQSKTGKIVFMNVFKFVAAACVITFVGIVSYRILFVKKNIDEQAIYASYFKPLTNTSSNIRGENDTTYEAKAAEAYEKEDYFEATNLYGKLVASNPANVKNNLFLGISYLGTNQPKKAIEVLNKITTSEEFHFDIQWYITLSYIKDKQLENALATLKNLVKEENYYQKEAQEITDKLDGKVAMK